MAVGRPGAPKGGGSTGDRRQRPAIGGGGGPSTGAPTSESAQEAVDAEWASAGAVGSSPRMQATVGRALAYALWTALVVALVLGLVNCAGAVTASPEAGGDGDSGDDAPLVSPPGGCAELVVAGWLAGDTELLADVPGLPRADPESGRRRAADTYTAAVTPGEGAWGYLIGATVQVREPADGGEQQGDNEQGNDEQGNGAQQGDDGQAARWSPAGVQFFRVTMVPSDSGGGCQGWAPAALPAQVPAPTLGGDSPQGYDASLPASDTELSETLEAFFSGMLTGGESLERYVAPGVHVAPLSPPPYDEVSVSGLRAREEPDPEAEVPPDGTVLQLLATVTTDADDLPLVYPATVGVRGGRWEVMSLDPLVGTSVLPQAAGETGAAERAAPANSADLPGSAETAGAGHGTNGG